MKTQKTFITLTISLFCLITTSMAQDSHSLSLGNDKNAYKWYQDDPEPYEFYLLASTGVGNSGRFTNADQKSMPLMLAFETANIGRRWIDTDFLVGGGYLGYRKNTYFSEEYGETTYQSFSFGTRATVLAFPLMNHFTGSTPKWMDGRIEPYLSFLLGYDYVAVSNDAHDEAYGLYDGSLYLRPVVGVRAYPVQNLGFFVEVGGNGQSTVNFGAVLRCK